MVPWARNKYLTCKPWRLDWPQRLNFSNTSSLYLAREICVFLSLPFPLSNMLGHLSVMWFTPIWLDSLILRLPSSARCFNELNFNFADFCSRFNNLYNRIFCVILLYILLLSQSIVEHKTNWEVICRISINDSFHLHANLVNENIIASCSEPEIVAVPFVERLIFGFMRGEKFIKHNCRDEWWLFINSDNSSATVYQPCITAGCIKAERAGALLKSVIGAPA